MPSHKNNLLFSHSLNGSFEWFIGLTLSCCLTCDVVKIFCQLPESGKLNLLKNKTVRKISCCLECQHGEHCSSRSQWTSSVSQQIRSVIRIKSGWHFRSSHHVNIADLEDFSSSTLPAFFRHALAMTSFSKMFVWPIVFLFCILQQRNPQLFHLLRLPVSPVSLLTKTVSDLPRLMPFLTVFLTGTPASEHLVRGCFSLFYVAHHARLGSQSNASPPIAN